MSDAEGPVIRDRRRVDPETGTARPDPTKQGDAVDEVAGDLVEGLAAEREEAQEVAADLESMEAIAVAEAESHRADLLRLKAEFDNYRKRVERDRELVRELAVAGVLTDLLPVLDDIDRADSHDELVGGFKSVADALRGSLTRLGLESYGEAGDSFDPNIHEALTHSIDDELKEATCVEVFQAGYRFGGRVLRPARVAVAEPEA